LSLAKSMACPNPIYSNRGNSQIMHCFFWFSAKVSRFGQFDRLPFKADALHRRHVRAIPIRVPLRIYNSSFPRVHLFIESIVSPTHAKIPFELAQRDERHSPCPSPRLDSNLLTSKRREGDYNLVPLSLGGMTQHDSFFCKLAAAQSSPLMVSALSPRLSTYGRDHVIPSPSPS
jgi:hypothetical protein